MHDDLYDFFLEALPGYDMVGYRETNLVNWGCFDDPDYVDYDYKNMTEWGRKRYITPGVAIGGELITTDLVEINLMIRILLGSLVLRRLGERADVGRPQDPLGNPVDKRHPWNKVTMPKPQKRDFTDKYTLGRVAAHATTSGPTRTSAATPAAGRSPASGARRRPACVDFGYAKATGDSIQMVLPTTRRTARDGARVEGARRSRTRSSATGPGRTTRPTRR